MPAGLLSKVFLRLAVSPAGSHSLPFPFSTPVGEINLLHPSGAPRPRSSLCPQVDGGSRFALQPCGLGILGAGRLARANLVWPQVLDSLKSLMPGFR